ncbi:sodium:solute symporter family protein [Halothiobacillus sp. DCM-1]|uniref:sodium:solute symporter family protein n=1 Tax=Halothiobacillus sp. DCM-1 TaxID=3112558 RepID=UPI00324E0719
MLIAFVVLYLVLSIVIGLLAARKVHNTADFMTTGRALPLPIVVGVVFATWFGAETVLGIPGTFFESNLGGLISDPFGAALCLVLFGLVFARRLYRMNLLTLGDFYRQRFDRRVEVIAAIAITLSYLGWVAAQITALGMVFNVLSQGVISESLGILLGATVVTLYTVIGGMWSVAITTFFQMIVIVVGMTVIAVVVGGMAGGIEPVVHQAVINHKFEFWPALNATAILAFIAGLLTLGFGSIPQQDVFQRANSAKTENAAVWGSVLGGVAYLLFAAIPLFIAYAATVIDPAMVQQMMAGDTDKILMALIQNHLPLWAQVVFYGSLLAVIMSTASGTLLAPSVTLAENLLKGWLAPSGMSDRDFLRLTRWVIIGFAVVVTAYSLWQNAGNTSIHTMVENAYKVTLVVAFVPLAAGLFWRRANRIGAYASIALGLAVWLPLEIFLQDPSIPPQFYGFAASILGMVAGSLLSRRV